MRREKGPVRYVKKRWNMSRSPQARERFLRVAAKIFPGVIDMEIKRDQYLNDLIIRKGNGLIKVITGIRRCGKSYLLNLVSKAYLHIIFLRE